MLAPAFLPPDLFRFMVPAMTLLPLVSAALCLMVSRRGAVQNVITLCTLTANGVLALLLLLLADAHGSTFVQVGGWEAPFGITLMVDRLSAFMLLVAAIVLLAVIVFAVGQGIRDGDQEQPVSIFLPTYLVLTAGLNNAFIAGDLFNLYVGFEILLAASYVLLTLGASQSRVRAGVSYTVVSMVSSLIFLLAIGFTYAAVGTLNIADVALRMQDVPESVRNAIFAVFLVAFGIKAAVFPLSSWLPDSYPTAPAPVTAVFAGLLTKVGVYAIIRMHSTIFPGGAMDNVLMVASLLTMLVGILGAIAQSDIKRILSFTLVSHIGYMTFGVALSSEPGLSAAIYYVAHHILVQTTMFLIVGLIERQAGSSSLRHLGSLAVTSPLLAVTFIVPALNLGGIPPFTGFIGKLAVIQAGAAKGSILAMFLIAGSVITSLLTLYVMVRIWTKAFWRPMADSPDAMVDAYPVALLPARRTVDQNERKSPGRMPATMLMPTLGLIAVSTAMVIWAGPLLHVTDRAANNLRDPQSYIATIGPNADVAGRDTTGPGNAFGSPRPADRAPRIADAEDLDSPDDLGFKPPRTSNPVPAPQQGDR